jgi:hypothetical protein
VKTETKNRKAKSDDSRGENESEEAKQIYGEKKAIVNIVNRSEGEGKEGELKRLEDGTLNKRISRG